MIDRSVLLLGSLVILGWPLPCFAKTENKETEARRVMFNYAKCVVRNHHNIASEMILSNSDNEVIQHRYSSLIDSACMGAVAGFGTSMSFGGDLYRYALADALVNADLSAYEEKNFSDRLPLAHLAKPSIDELKTSLTAAKSARKRTEIQKGFDKALTNSWLSQFGECVVRKNPVASRYWILTAPDSPEEISRINELRPNFAECLDEGTLKFNRIVLRGTVALNYYRLSFSTRQKSAGSLH